MLKLAGSTLILGLLTGCTTSSKKLNLSSSETSEVFSLDLEQESGQWQKIGETPVELAMQGEKIELYKIQNKDKKDQFVLMPSKVPEGVLNIDFDLLEKTTDEEKKDTAAPRMDKINDAIASVLRAYAALWKKAPDTAIQLAEQAEEITPGLIGPPLIQALALLMKNNLEEAKAMLEVAKTRPRVNATIIEEIESKINQAN